MVPGAVSPAMRAGGIWMGNRIPDPARSLRAALRGFRASWASPRKVDSLSTLSGNPVGAVDAA